MGCERKISLDLRHRPRISPSDSWTFLPGLAPRTVEQLQQTLQMKRRRSQGPTKIGTQSRTAAPHSRYGPPAAYLPRVSKLCCRCSICHCLSLFRRARCVCRDYCRAGVRGRGDSCSRRTMLDGIIECGVKPACEVQIRANDRDTAKWWYDVSFCRKPNKNNKIKYFVYVIATDEKGTPSYSSRVCKVKWLKWRSLDVTSSTIFSPLTTPTAPGNVYSSTTGTEYRPFFKIIQNYYGGVVICSRDGVLCSCMILFLLTF